MTTQLLGPIYADKVDVANENAHVAASFQFRAMPASDLIEKYGDLTVDENMVGLFSDILARRDELDRQS